MDEIICKKLNIGKFNRKAIIGCPPHVDAFEGVAYDTSLGTGSYDLIVHFIFTLQQFHDRLMDIIAHRRLNEGGVVYFAYPKKGNKRYDQFIGRDDFFTIIDMNADGYVAQSTVKFNKMVAFDDTFTVIGLKNEPRKRASSQPSQCVGAYVDRLPELEERLSAYPDALEFYRRLTPGYQRGWARYVYAVKSEATQEKHFQEMVAILRQGHKSIDLYRQALGNA